MTTRAATSDFLCLRGGGTMIALAVPKNGRAQCHYAGPELEGVEARELAMLSVMQHAPGGPEQPIVPSLLNCVGTGFAGAAGLTAHRDGRDWAIDPRVTHVEQKGTHHVTLTCEDANCEITITHQLVIDPETGVLTCSSEIANTGQEILTLDWCAALCLPLPQRLNHIMSFTGKWAGEFQIERTEALRGSIVRENTAGRTSHDVFPGFFLHAADTSETAGPAAGFHLTWSGNSRLRVDTVSDGRAQVQMGEMFFPGEMRLDAGEKYQTPDTLAAWSDAGLGAVSHAFHQHLRKSVLDPRTNAKPRPVHYNTWEAIYFDHDEAALFALADKAAAVGAERFVLDDGWFGGRRHDAAGLGDWWVSPDVYPCGLKPFTDHIHTLGMEFGLWFEPEMVNPDSDLFRAHPDWVLDVSGVDPIASRGQLPLNLTRTEVSDHLFDRIDEIVRDLGVDYIKWDMNRDIQHPGSSDGRAAAHRQTLAVYALIDRLRAAHPKLEIESCASGGGRADFGILRRTDRIWTSDNNDARSRHRIMRGASHFLPLNVLGNHVGPRRCHITGRQFDMAMRAGTAVFGHMGMELDLRDESAADITTLKAAIAIHKRHRELIHTGRFWRLHSSANANFVGCVNTAQSEGLFSYTVLNEGPHTHPAMIRFDGIDPAKKYRLSLVWPAENPSISSPSIIDAADLQGQGNIFSGAALMGHGIQPPLTFADTCLIYHLKATD